MRSEVEFLELLTTKFGKNVSPLKGLSYFNKVISQQLIGKTSTEMEKQFLFSLIYLRMYFVTFQSETENVSKLQCLHSMIYLHNCTFSAEKKTSAIKFVLCPKYA